LAACELISRAGMGAVLRERASLYIGGGWSAARKAKIDVCSPATLKYVGSAPEANAEDVDLAVRAARTAFDHGPWPRLSGNQRAVILHKMAEYLREVSAETADLLCDEIGVPLTMMRAGAGAVPAMLDMYAELGATWNYETPRQGMTASARVRQEPVGVVGAIAPWNGPFFLAVIKAAPAMAAGCTVVIKPAPETPLDIFYLADAAEKAGLPPGVLNIVPGGRDIGELLVRHPGVDKIAFTGSTLAGRKIASICGQDLKRCSLELGGKSAAIVLEDARIEDVVATAIPYGLAFNNGQACAALTRILVPTSRYGEVVGALAEATSKLKVGDPRDPQTQIGPLIAERQRDRVEGYIRKGVAEGARIVVGGGRPKGLDVGWYVSPTLFADASNDMVIAQEEIFGPVGVVIRYDGGDDAAVALSNASEYGLGGAVLSADTERALGVARRIRTGTIGLNSYRVDLKCPFGGYKASGIGREMGVEGFANFLETKTIFG
jgi:betaine-aldehyde dehydrogenase